MFVRHCDFNSSTFYNDQRPTTNNNINNVSLSYNDVVDALLKNCCALDKSSSIFINRAVYIKFGRSLSAHF